MTAIAKPLALTVNFLLAALATIAPISAESETKSERTSREVIRERVAKGNADRENEEAEESSS